MKRPTAEPPGASCYGRQFWSSFIRLPMMPTTMAKSRNPAQMSRTVLSRSMSGSLWVPADRPQDDAPKVQRSGRARMRGCRAVLREETAGGESDPRCSEDENGGAGRSLGKRQHAAKVARMGNTGHAGRRDDEGDGRVMDARAKAGRHAVRGMGRCGCPALPLLAAGLAEGSRKGGGRRKRTRHHKGQGVASQARQGHMASAGDEQQDGNGRADAACHPESWSRPHDSRLFSLLTVQPQEQHRLFLYFQRYRPRAALSTTACPAGEGMRARCAV